VGAVAVVDGVAGGDVAGGSVTGGPVVGGSVAGLAVAGAALTAGLESVESAGNVATVPSIGATVVVASIVRS
jgi:hypothetical protein